MKTLIIFSTSEPESLPKFLIVEGDLRHIDKSILTTNFGEPIPKLIEDAFGNINNVKIRNSLPKQYLWDVAITMRIESRLVVQPPEN